MNDPALETLWKRVVDEWENESTHGAFLEHCQITDQLLEAAVRYRGMAGDRDRGPSADKRLQGVAVLAVAKLESMRTPKDAARRDAGKVLLIAVFIAATIAMLVTSFR